ncbi:MAG: PHP domain-containing protein [Promethearchaeota archaeon]|nr:MAG: PHP domain-containing protein [Candidatus Lokiarchaeota archaeon]
MDFPKMNLHSHSDFTDGKDSIKKMVNKALKVGLDYLAITDHFTNSWKSDIISTLDTPDKIEDYLNEIEACQKFLKENNKNLQVLKGIEIDLGSNDNYIRRLIQPEKFEIILFEYLETLEGLAFLKNLIIYWENNLARSNFPLLGLAHLDPSFFIYHGLDRLIQVIKKYDIYIEINARYSHYYNRKNEPFFERLRKFNIPVAIGTDAHFSRRLGFIDELYDILHEYELEKNFRIFIEKLHEKE